MSLANFQPRGKPQKEAENVATTPEVADEATDIMLSDEWSELKNNYGPILSPLPPTPPRVRPPEIHVPMRPTHGPSGGTILSRSEFVWSDAEHAIETMCFEQNEFPGVKFCSFDLRIEDEGQTLSPEQRKKINDLIRESTDLFAEHGPPTPQAEHRKSSVSNFTATVGNPANRNRSPPRVGNNLVLVPKPGGKVRVCIDYRKLNAITIVDNYPLPRLEDLLHSTGDAAFISTVDLKASYYQIQVAEADQDKTAFITPFGL
jgi:hypothetical protein